MLIIDMPKDAINHIGSFLTAPKQLLNYKLACRHISEKLDDWVLYRYTDVEQLVQYGKIAALQGLSCDQIEYPGMLLLYACEYNQLDIAKMVTKRFELTIYDARIGFGMVLYHVCTKGYSDIMQWLLDQFKFEKADMLYREDGTYPFKTACIYGHLDVAKLLHERFDFCASDIVSGEEDIVYLGTAVYPHVQAWLHDTFGQNNDDN